jgi:hypothetical protein
MVAILSHSRILGLHNWIWSPDKNAWRIHARQKNHNHPYVIFGGLAIVTVYAVLDP